MKPINVICPGCKGQFHTITDKFDPDVTPNGSMFRLLPNYGPDGGNWSTFPESESAEFAELACPMCGAEYLDDDFRVTLSGPVKSKPKPKEPANPVDRSIDCPVCGKTCKSKSGLTSHMRSHEND